ncbi:Hcp family type VI secretion system effector [Aliikangiella sp. IMCC44359]|uniref:Hcp family type VI secretion system effector n=1 Tax=Aliikangiella sp. IMCC44359 TaxID=3459125 RepID=UPI00403ADDD0
MDLVLLKPGLADLAGASLIDGELVDKNDDIAGCIELVSMHFGMKQQMTTDVSNAARTSGRPNLNDITAVKYLDKTSPLLYKHCLSATPIDDGTADAPTQIFLCRNVSGGGDASLIGNIMTVKLWNCMISSVEAQSHPNDMATEQITLNYTDIEWVTSNQDSQAAITGSFVYSWSVARNRGVM